MTVITILTFILFVLICAEAVFIIYRRDEEDDLYSCRAPEALKVRYLVDDLMPLAKTIRGDWIDMRAAADVEVKAGEYIVIPLGVAIKLPRGYEAVIAPRSSLFKHHGLICPNSIGVIDESYCGNNDEWHFVGYATRDTAIKKNERICQFRIFHHMPWMDIMTVAELCNDDRGGIGSSGRM